MGLVLKHIFFAAGITNGDSIQSLAFRKTCPCTLTDMLQATAKIGGVGGGGGRCLGGGWHHSCLQWSLFPFPVIKLLRAPAQKRIVDYLSLKGSPSVGMSSHSALKWQNYHVQHRRALAEHRGWERMKSFFLWGVCGSSKGWGWNGLRGGLGWWHSGGCVG